MHPSELCQEAGPLWLFCELGVAAVLLLVGLAALVERAWEARSSDAGEAQNGNGADHDDGDA